MPIYEYGCGSCGHLFEELQRSTDPDPERCPACGAGEVERVISRTSFLLKGGGWYAQDYSSTPATSGGEAAATGGEATTGGDATTTSESGTADTGGTKSESSSASATASSAAE